jgi:Ca2+-binding RTX toxin-like protein
VASLLNGSNNKGDAAGDTYLSIENLTGSQYRDVLSGNAGSNVIDGGAGDDVLIGWQGADVLVGGSGLDTASYLNSAAGVSANLAGPGANTGDAAGDTYLSIENLIGTRFDDRLVGSDSDNRLTGDAGNDVLIGRAGLQGAGDDLLDGGTGYDRLDGRDGRDLLVGGAGGDVLTGGADADTFRFLSTSDSTWRSGTLDKITDFGSGDVVDLGAIDANSQTPASDAFTFTGTTAFQGTAGELHYRLSGGSALVEADVNGDKVADLSILILGQPVLSASDINFFKGANQSDQFSGGRLGVGRDHREGRRAT